MRLSEVSIAVEDLRLAMAAFSSWLGTPASEVGEVRQVPVQARFASFDTGAVSIGIMESTGAGSPIERFLKARGPGLFSITFQTSDIAAEIARLEKAGAEFVLAEPLVLENYTNGLHRYRECLVNFTRPRSTGGVVLELQELRE